MKRTRKQLAALKVMQQPARRNRQGRHKGLWRKRSRRALSAILNIAIGEAITTARLKKGISQIELAVQVPGLYDAQAIFHLERGVTAPSLIQLRTMAQALDTTIHALVPEAGRGH